MMDPRRRHAALFVTACLVSSGLLFGQGIASAKNPAGASPPTGKPVAAASPAATATPIPLTDIAEKSQAAITRLNALSAENPANESGVSGARETNSDLSARIDQWLTNSTKTLGQRPSLDVLHDLQSSGGKLTEELHGQTALLDERAKALGDESAVISGDETTWTATAQAAKDPSVPPETLALCESVLTQAKDATAKIKVRRSGLLELQSQQSALAGKLSAGLESVRQANAAALKDLFVRDGAPLWAAQTALNAGNTGAELESPGQQATAALNYIRRHPDLLCLHGAIFLILLGILLWLRHRLHEWTEEDPALQRAAPILEVPMAAALALSFVVKGTIYSDAPVAFRAGLGIVLLLPMIVLLRRLLDRRLHAALYFLILFYFVGQVRTTVANHLLLNRWILSATLLVAIVVFGWVAKIGRSRRTAESGAGAVLGKRPLFLCRLAILLLLGALVAEVIGYVRLGTTVGTAVLRSSYAAVFLYALVQILAGLLLICLRVRPLSISHIARQHSATVHRRICRSLGLIAFIGWFWLTLGLFELQNLAASWTTVVLDAHKTVGEVSLSLGNLLGFAAALWLSVLVARLTRFFLEEEVFERINLSPGLPYAIATMFNYVLLLVGSLIALGILGVPFASLTFLAGAFSVGLGFGLQNIINNFVSGVILLFERPVKVGDIIQIGDAVGEVRRIGIRASVIGTRDGSDIIVPNGNLISNQFTNWTYSDRHRFVEIPLSIAGGPDPNHVLALLKATAAAHSATKDQAAPQAYVTALTGAGISLVVRAWISQYEDWVQTRSELAVALVGALTTEGIKLA